MRRAPSRSALSATNLGECTSVSPTDPKRTHVDVKGFTTESVRGTIVFDTRAQMVCSSRLCSPYLKVEHTTIAEYGYKDRLR